MKAETKLIREADSFFKKQSLERKVNFIRNELGLSISGGLTITDDIKLKFYKKYGSTNSI